MSDPDVRGHRRAFASVQCSDLGVFFRYAVVGVSQNATFYGLALVLIYNRFAAWQAAVILTPFAIGVSFLLNRSWSFVGRKRRAAELRKYLLVYAIAYVAGVAVIWAQERAGVPSWMASLITQVVGAIGIFLALNVWVFRKAPGGEVNSEHY